MAEGKTTRATGCVFGGLVVAALLVAGAAIGGVAWYSGQGGIEEGTVLELTIDGPLSEGPTQDFFAELTGQTKLSLYDVRRGLRAAAEDEDVAGLRVRIGTPALGQAALEELASELERFGEHKPVHTLLQTDMITDGNLYLATAGTKVWATPAAFWMVDGYRVDIPFWRGTLEKLHVEPDFVMFKEYKSAGEPYSRYEMSEHMREALDDVIGDLQQRWYDVVAERRGVDRAALVRFVDAGMSTGPAAGDLGLVDDFGYVDTIEEALREVAGTEEYEGLSLAKYLGQIEVDDADTRVALVFGEGPIVADAGPDNPFASGATIYGPQVAKAIRQATEDDAVKAIVFRVSSPGGSAVGSDLVWREIERAQEQGKPVVVSMSSIAGSGGYWVAMGADAIVAHPSTITGSIGVVFGKFNIRGFYEWIGASVETLKYTENADLMSPYASLTEEQRATLISSMDVLYSDFKRKVSEGRGIDYEAMEALARGRIWSGIDAEQHGLVDALGGLDTALEIAAEKGSFALDDARVVVYPKKKELIDMLLEGELGVTTDPVPDLAAVERLVHELSTPRVWAWMPDFRLE